MRNVVACCSLFLAFAVGTSPCRAQIRVVGPGSTVRGDELRGEGVFLQGLGWYELNDAKAFDQYAKTVRDNDAYLRQQNAEARRAYNAQVDAEARRQRMNEAAKRRYLAEREARLRANPTPEDIEAGDALNALLVDLSDPTIQPSSWRGSKVDLPEDISIKGLAFQFTPKPGAKASAALTQGLIVLGRLDTTGRWPDVFPLEKLKPELAAYEAAYAAIRAQAQARRLDLGAVLALDRSLKALRAKVEAVVPADRGFRAEAIRYVDNLIAAARMFDASTLGYAREMIADTSQHEAHTVGELLAFMRKYRLIFARADAAPGGSEVYARLYGLLKQQSEALGIKPEQESAPTARIEDSKWVPLFDGRTLSGWTIANGTPGTWRVEEGGVIHGSGPASHLFSPRGDYKNFRYKAEVKIADRANSGMYFRAEKGPGFPNGYEAQINSTHADPVRTGSLYNLVKVTRMLVPPDTWFTQEVEAIGDHITIKVNGKRVVDYSADPSRDRKNYHKEGYFAFQQHDPRSEVWIRNVEVMELPDEAK